MSSSFSKYYGFKKLNDIDFFDYCRDCDKIIDGLDSKSDGFAEGRCIINYILDVLDNKYTLTIPINLYSNSREFIDVKYYQKLLETKIICYFEFNKNHVWFNKKR